MNDRYLGKNRAKNYIVIDKNKKTLNTSVLTDRDPINSKVKKGTLLKSHIDQHKTIDEVASIHLTSVEKPISKAGKMNINSHNEPRYKKKKLSSGMTKKFDKAIALTSRVTRVSLDHNKKHNITGGTTGSSLSYTQKYDAGRVV